MHARLSLLLLAAIALSVNDAGAQRRPGQRFGFFTTTDLVTLDVEGGSVTATTPLTETARFALSAIVTAPLIRQRTRAWIVGVRGTALSLGNRDRCIDTSAPQGGDGECDSRKFTERVTLLAGGAFDIRSTILRVMAGPVAFQLENGGMRVGTNVRLDFASPRQSGVTPTLFLTRSFVGSVDGTGAAMTTLGAGFRWVRK